MTRATAQPASAGPSAESPASVASAHSARPPSSFSTTESSSLVKIGVGLATLAPTWLGSPDAAGPAFVVLDVLGVVGEATGLPFAEYIQRGELKTYVVLDGRRIDYINRYVNRYIGHFKYRYIGRYNGYNRKHRRYFHLNVHRQRS